MTSIDDHCEAETARAPMKFGNIVSSAAEFLEDLAEGFAGLFGGNARSYVDLETAVGSNILVSNDGAMMSLLRMNGSTRMVGEAEFLDIVSGLSVALSSSMKKKGHVIQVSFSNDGAGESLQVALNGQFSGMKRAADKLDLALDDVLADRRKIVHRNCSMEMCTIALWTTRSVVPEAEWKDERKKELEEIKGQLVGKDSQSQSVVARVLIDPHVSFVKAVMIELDKRKIDVEALNKHDAVHAIRKMVDPEFTSEDWKPILPGDPYRVRIGDFASCDPSFMMIPDLQSQIIPRPPVAQSFRTVQVGDRIYTPICVYEAPKSKLPFPELLSRMRTTGIPWRIMFTIAGGGLSEKASAMMAADNLRLGSPSNRQQADEFRKLRKREELGDAIVSFRMMATTWAGAGEYTRLSENTSRLSRSIQSWGGADVTEVTGNPLSGLFSTVPGITLSSVAPAAVAPFEDALSFLPWHRPASPWGVGSIPLRTPDGKLFPYRAYSSLQDAWISLIFGPMGSGKSVTMNTLHQGLLLDDTNESIPYIRILEIGRSSEGFVKMTQQALPSDKQHVAQYHRIKNTGDFAWNMFDTLIGQRRPSSDKLAFIVNLLTLLATPLGASKPEDGIDGIAQMSVDLAYRRLGDSNEGAPRNYSRHMDPIVDRVIDQYGGLDLPDQCSWWQVVDALAKKGEYRIASLAQRFAVPTLQDIVRETQSSQVTGFYTGSTATNESISKYFQRKILEAIEQFPMLSNPTRFDLEDCPIVSLDLNDVVIKGSEQAKRQTAIMYLVGMRILCQDFYLGDDLIDEISDDYKDFYRARVKQLRRVKKRLCADEFNRLATSAPSAVSMVEQTIREGRKWQIEVMLASQLWEDFSDEMVKLATTIFILKAPETGLSDLCSKFGFNETEEYVIGNRLMGPTKDGANLVLRMSTKRGRFTHLVTNSIGATEMWASSSTAEEVSVRDALYREYPRQHHALVRRALGDRFPGGLKSEIENRLSQRTVSGMGRQKSPIDEVLAEVRVDIERRLAVADG